MKRRFLAALLVFSLCISAVLLCSCNAQKSYSVASYRTTMQFYEDFKILQLTDLHFGIETNLALQLDVVKNAIRKEAPDLIVLTGDNFMYSNKAIAQNLVKMLNEECAALTEARGGRLTKFTLTFGNHDNQGDYPRYFLNDLLLSYVAPDGEEIAQGKYCAFIDYEDDDLFGLANFYIDLVDSSDVKYRLHIIDSNTYHYMGGLDYEYDIIHDEQLEHAIKIKNEATPDRDYIGLAFFHIPFNEFDEAYKQFESSGSGQGELNEDSLSGYKNAGAFEKLRSAGIVAFFCGHDHVNYGDFIYNADSADISKKAIFSYGVKSTNQLYHEKDMIGYKTITLKGDMTLEEFLTFENISENFYNFTGGYSNYEK